MSCVAVITARGGSKRIPGKNIKSFCGRPIIEYSIEAAVKSGVFDEIMVSTDDKEIAEISVKAGAKVPFMRSAAASNDYAVTSDVLLEVVDEYRKQGREFDYLCCLYPTAPFVTAERLKEAFDLIKSSKEAPLVMPLVKFSFPPQRCFMVENGKGFMPHPEYKLSRSQDLKPMYHDCGQFYFWKVTELIKCGRKGSDKIIPMFLSEMEVQDIDSEIDWQLAELKYKLLKGQREARPLIPSQM